MLVLPCVLFVLNGCAATKFDMQPLDVSDAGPMWLHVEKSFKGSTIASGLFRCTENDGKVQCVKAEFVDSRGSDVPWANE